MYRWLIYAAELTKKLGHITFIIPTFCRSTIVKWWLVLCRFRDGWLLVSCLCLCGISSNKCSVLLRLLPVTEDIGSRRLFTEAKPCWTINDNWIDGHMGNNLLCVFFNESGWRSGHQLPLCLQRSLYLPEFQSISICLGGFLRAIWFTTSSKSNHARTWYDLEGQKCISPWLIRDTLSK